MKMYCKIKRPDNAKEKIEKGEKIIIQEKIDGSNTAIYNDNGTIRYFSRSNELTGEDGLSGFVKYAKSKEDKIQEEIYDTLEKDDQNFVVYNEYNYISGMNVYYKLRGYKYIDNIKVYTLFS